MQLYQLLLSSITNRNVWHFWEGKILIWETNLQPPLKFAMNGSQNFPTYFKSQTFFSSSSIAMSSRTHSPGAFCGLKNGMPLSSRKVDTSTLHVEDLQVPPRNTLSVDILSRQYSPDIRKQGNFWTCRIEVVKTVAMVTLDKGVNWCQAYKKLVEPHFCWASRAKLTNIRFRVTRDSHIADEDSNMQRMTKISEREFLNHLHNWSFNNNNTLKIFCCFTIYCRKDRPNRSTPNKCLSKNLWDNSRMNNLCVLSNLVCNMENLPKWFCSLAFPKTIFCPLKKTLAIPLKIPTTVEQKFSHVHIWWPALCGNKRNGQSDSTLVFQDQSFPAKGRHFVNEIMVLSQLLWNRKQNFTWQPLNANMNLVSKNNIPIWVLRLRHISSSCKANASITEKPASGIVVG